MHFNMGPPYGVIACSISSADVPGAKFSAITTHGPARPRIEKPVEGLEPPTILNWLFADGAAPLIAEYNLASLGTRAGLGPELC